MGFINSLNVLIVGGGAREHALAWTLARSPQVSQLYIAPGNGGTVWTATDDRAAASNIPIAADDIGALLAFARDHQIDLTVVGPEAPLAAGIVDQFQAAGLPIFGPTRQAALLESSKSFAKHFMQAHAVPTDQYRVFQDYQSALEALLTFLYPMVIKADGLAAGKGVFICANPDESQAVLHRLMVEREFGDAGSTVVLEEYLSGPEVSLLAFSDGKTIAVMPPARDHKRIYDNDRGPNTGGMGAYSPLSDVSAVQIEAMRRSILQPVIDGMAALGTPYTGILYAGIMLTAEGPKVLEYNCRFGDPETQVILPLLESDLVDIMVACIAGTLDRLSVRWRAGAAATIVLASPGYPDEYPRGLPISGLSISGLEPPLKDVTVFHGGTLMVAGQLVTAGGRVLSVSATGSDLSLALARAYAGVSHIHFEGMHYRRDIGRTQGVPLSAYQQAGVNIDAGNQTIGLIKAAVTSTYGPQVLAGIGSFGGLYDASRLTSMTAPILVASTDGVGTKTKVAARMGRWDTIGCDLVNHCVNDILVQGAQPLFFLDYVASSRIDPQQVALIVSGMATACREVGCALLGGETAEMPGVYEAGEIDLVGTIIGLVDREHLIDGSRIRGGDVILGLASSGLHTNGYSLARQALDGLDWNVPIRELGGTPGDALLKTHLCYLTSIRRLQSAGVDIHGLAHITGGGIVENLPRILPAQVGAHIHEGSWPILPIFDLIQRLGNINKAEMYRVFNMGLGMLVIVPPEHVEMAQAALANDLYVVGETIAGEGVRITEQEAD